MTIKIRYHGDVTPLEKIPQGDWIDLRAAETVEMKAGEYRLISLGVSMQLPKGYEAHVAPRSSTFKKWGVIQANSLGIIDESYCGDHDIWYFPALAMRDTVIERVIASASSGLWKKCRRLPLKRWNFFLLPIGAGLALRGKSNSDFQFLHFHLHYGEIAGKITIKEIPKWFSGGCGRGLLTQKPPPAKIHTIYLEGLLWERCIIRRKREILQRRS